MSSKAKQSQKLLLFRLSGSRLFGIGTLKIREILPYKPLTKLPHSHHAVVGTTSFRGSAVPVIDMAAAVGYPALTQEEQQKSSIIITDVQRQETGFLVRGVQKIIETDWKKVKAPPAALGEKAFITGLLDVEGDIIQLLDVELLLANVYPDSLNTGDVALTDVQSETLRALNILLVDDSRIARKQLCDVLDAKDIPYQVTTNGDEALQVLLKDNELGQPVDILVSDIEMPGLDGYELTFDVRDNGVLKQPYVILHTSLNSEMSLSYANQVGANEALTKFDADELLHAMLRGARQPG
ncbi:MAG: two-component system chemotaxis response regulator CheV [Marinobacter maritimus]|jgi:two-component system chemotaxis response regulator CheV|uniref:chemotaxis protein n=1 Tax=Marinobacter maritimus TaxID=277961 RepID=UPI000BC46261|nr:chemotaxis protein [Marinobacter maritimus]MBL1271346.1 chemotaxis protein CheV [Oceanospirillales bacterium]|tara:strand:- start:398 stop:1285 length:888 start_codon:yes stop_codon:yes gene_type:complete